MPTPIVRPPFLQIPFANSGGYNTIPIPSQIGITDGAASYTDGFPPLTRTPIAAGGVPPSGLDMNGILFALSEHVTFLNGGQRYRFDATLATAIGGYPVGTVLQSNDGLSEYLNILANNSTDFNSTPTSIGVSWIPYGGKGNKGQLSGFTSVNASTTLTLAQLGSLIAIASATAIGQTFTLPTLASVNNNASGNGYWLINLSSFQQTIKGNGSEVFIFPGGGTFNAFLLNPGDFIFVSNQATTQWNVFGLITNNAFPSSIGTNGYQKLPNGLILQWGTSGTIATTALATITLPLTFPTALLNVSACRNDDPGAVNTANAIAAIPLSSSQFRIRNGTAVSVTPMWFAIGW